jgi:hypothetical protein
MNAKYLILILIPFLAGACSNRQMYDAVKNRQKVLCESVPRSEYSECMEQANESYDSYERDREEIEESR